MALQSERDELLAAWRALDSAHKLTGWRTIPVAPHGPCRLLAGRHFPGNEEALLVGFAKVGMPPASHLPQGEGFLVSTADLGPENIGHVWISLLRKSAGSLDLFAMMAVDIVATLEAMHGGEDQGVLQAFLARIRAWQNFMRRGGENVLRPEEEVGLFGELVVLLDLVHSGLPAFLVVDAWRGPLDGIHDFSLGAGAIEVKTTVDPSGFPMSVASLEQLDDSLIHPIFLGGVRLALDPAGTTLPAGIDNVRQALREDKGALEAFNSLLLHVGFLESTRDRYTRRFTRKEIRILLVSAAFPRLTRGNVALEVRAARYDLELDLSRFVDVGLNVALEQLGVA